MTREQIAAELLRDMPDDAGLVADHEAIAEMLTRGLSAEKILASPACDRWPDTYFWLKSVLTA